jgi:hypothetical protein
MVLVFCSLSLPAKQVLQTTPWNSQSLPDFGLPRAPIDWGNVGPNLVGFRGWEPDQGRTLNKDESDFDLTAYMNVG